MTGSTPEDANVDNAAQLRMDISTPAAPQSSQATKTTAMASKGANSQKAKGPQPYVPQFAAETPLILERLRRSSKSPDAESSGVSNLLSESDKAFSGLIKLEPMPSQSISSMAIPAKPETQKTLRLPPGPDSETAASIRSSLKRKRDLPADKLDFTQSTLAFPWTNKPESSHQLQLRERPMDVSQQNESPRLRVRTSQQDLNGSDKLRERRLAALPEGVVPAKPELIGFPAGRASDMAVSTTQHGIFKSVSLTLISQRTQYFSSIGKTDLLNILSLCDQLKPQLLVDVLVSVSKKHPNLPIFNSPDWESQLPSPARPFSTRPPHEKPRHGHVLLNKAKQRQKATKKILKRTRVIEVVTDAPFEDEDVLPPTWQKANEGLYAKLPPETEDREYLLDENDEESFSQFFVDSFGKQIVEPVGA